MDYTPIDARRVLFAVGLTLMVGLTPAAFCLLEAGVTVPVTFAGIEGGGGYGGVALVVGSLLLSTVVACIGMFAVRLGQRAMRRPLRA